MANSHSLDLERSSSQYASCADSASLSITSAITMEGWIKLEQLASTAGGMMQIFDKHSSFQFYINNADDKLYFISTSDGTYGAATQIQAKSNTALGAGNVGVWTHVAVTVDAPTKAVVFYINGSAVGTTYNFQNATAFYNSANGFFIGAEGTPSLYFDGKIDEARVWNVVRSGANIGADYLKELVGNETNLQAYWKLNNNYNDSTSNANTLTGSGTPVFSPDVPFGASSFFLMF